MVEKALMVAAVALALCVGATALGQELKVTFCHVAGALQPDSIQVCERR